MTRQSGGSQEAGTDATGTDRLPILNVSQKRRDQIKADRPRSQWGMLAFVLAVLSGLMVFAFVWLRPKEQVYNLKTYTVAQVAKATILETASAAGTVVPERVLNLSVPAAGKLIELNVSPGDEVKPGTVLARIESTELLTQARLAEVALSRAQEDAAQARIRSKTELIEKQATVRLAQVRMSQLMRALGDIQDLYRLGAAAKIDVEKVQADLLATQAELGKAQQAVSDTVGLQAIAVETSQRAVKDAQDGLLLARKKASQSVLTTSVEGRVLDVKAQQGDDIQAGGLLISIADTRRMRVDAGVDESTAARVKVGQPVRLLIGNSDYQGEVAQVAPQAVVGPNGSNVPIRVQFVGTVPKLRPNVSAALEITVGTKKNVASLPRSPFLTTGGERLVFVLTSPDKAVRREVTFGVSNAERIEIVSGLSVGEKVITSSMEAYKEQIKIQLSPTGALKDGQELNHE
jgi:HlyD family secretion protein